jgi:hypothetical protein
VFYVAAILNIVAAVMALAVLKPMRLRMMAQKLTVALGQAQLNPS